MTRYKMEYKVRGEVMLTIKSAEGEDYESFLSVCRQAIAEFEEVHPEYQNVGHADVEDDWTTRQIW